MRATLAQIAQKSGVSKPTVSQILGDKGHLYRAETREKVVRVARSLGYQPNAYARGMAKGSFGAIGVLLSTDASAGAMSGGTAWALQQEALNAGLHLVLGQAPDATLTDEGAMPRLLSEWSVDGLLLNYTSHVPRPMMDLLAKHRLPSVWMNVKLPNDCVYPDDFEALNRATRRLLDLGHRRIAYLAFLKRIPSSHYSVTDRRGGYLAAMQEAGLTGQVFWEEGLEKDQQFHAMSELLRRPDRPTAFVTYGDTEASVVMMAAAYAGLRAPKDFSLIATQEFFTRICGLEVAAVEIPEYAMGRRAFEMVREKIASPMRVLEAQPLSFEFHDGGTCAAPPM